MRQINNIFTYNPTHMYTYDRRVYTCIHHDNLVPLLIRTKHLRISILLIDNAKTSLDFDITVIFPRWNRFASWWNPATGWWNQIANSCKSVSKQSPPVMQFSTRIGSRINVPGVSDGINVDKGSTILRSFRRSEEPIPRTMLEATFSFITFRRLTAMRELLFVKSQLRRCWLNARVLAFPQRERESTCPKREVYTRTAGIKCASPAVFRLSLV